VLETLPPVHCAAASHSGSYLQIDRAMGRLLTGLAAQQLMPPAPRMRAVFFDDPELVQADWLRSQAFLPLVEEVALAPPLQRMALRGGLCARLRYKGPYADMRDACRWLPERVKYAHSGTVVPEPRQRRSVRPKFSIDSRISRRL